MVETMGLVGQSRKADNKSSWEKWGENAESERIAMMGEFHVWAVAARQKIEARIITAEHHSAAVEPFARAGMHSAATPADVPLCVLEFADTALRLMEYRRQMEMLNAYYKQGAHWGAGQEHLTVEGHNSAAINALWDWFLEDQEEKSEQAQAKAA
jgi:hypothetical protein